MMSRESRQASLREERRERGSSLLFSFLLFPFLGFLDCRLEEGPEVPGGGGGEPEDRRGGTLGLLLTPGREDGINEMRVD
jgi:hypothetical protein